MGCVPSLTPDSTVAAVEYAIIREATDLGGEVNSSIENQEEIERQIEAIREEMSSETKGS